MNSLLILFFFGITSIFAQLPQQQQQPTEVTDTEIGKFANAFKKIQSIDQQAQGKMVSAVEKEGIEVQRFTELLNAQQDPNKEVDANEDELKKFNSANQKIEKIQKVAQKDMQKQIADEGLTINRYQEILATIRNDASMQEKLQKHLEKEE